MNLMLNNVRVLAVQGKINHKYKTMPDADLRKIIEGNAALMQFVVAQEPDAEAKAKAESRKQKSAMPKKKSEAKAKAPKTTPPPKKTSAKAPEAQAKANAGGNDDGSKASPKTSGERSKAKAKAKGATAKSEALADLKEEDKKRNARADQEEDKRRIGGKQRTPASWTASAPPKKKRKQAQEDEEEEGENENGWNGIMSLAGYCSCTSRHYPAIRVDGDALRGRPGVALPWPAGRGAGAAKLGGRRQSGSRRLGVRGGSQMLHLCKISAPPRSACRGRKRGGREGRR